MSPSKFITIESARDLFRLILPLLKSENDSVVASVVNALSFTGRAVYKVLLEEMRPIVKNIFSDDSRAKTRDRLYINSLRVEIGHIYHLTADFFQQQTFEPDEGQ